MKVIVKSPFEVMRIFTKGILDAKVVEYKSKKGILINDTECPARNFRFIREVCGSLRCANEIDEEKADMLNVLDDSEFSLGNYIYAVTEENTYNIKEDLKKAGAKWDSVHGIWYFEKENNTFKNEKVYII